MSTAFKRGGQPSKLDAVVGRTPDGAPITAGDRVLQAIRAGNYVETAAGMAGIAKASVYEWLTTGARAYGRLHRGEKVTAHERRCMKFSDAVADATAQSEAQDVARLAMLAQGGLDHVITTVKIDENGNEVERTTRTERTLPDARVLMWRLERRFGDRWGRQRIEVGPVTPTELVDVDDVRRLRDELAERRELNAG